MKFRIISLGCPKNLVESEFITHQLIRDGHVLSDDCDAVVVNTCAFIGDAAKESIETVLEEAMAKESTGGRLIVTGCLVDRYKESLKELLPEVDLFVGRNCYEEIGSLIGTSGFVRREGMFSATFPRKILTPRPMAYLKIQEGCDNRCTYCTVPDIRGPLSGRDEGSIREEFEWLLSQGYREINIVGQDITSYGKHSGTNLKALLKTLLTVPGDYWLRLLYMHPRRIDEELVEMMAHEKRIIPYMDMPIQHTEDSILRAMGRGYGRADLERLLAGIRAKAPDMTLRTTLILGFPGETEEDFAGLLEFVKKWEFDMLGAFMYSKEEGTPAFRMKGQVKKAVKKKRYETVMEMQQEISKRRLSRLMGRTVKVIIEGKEEEQMVGRLLTQAPDIDGVAFVRGGGSVGEIREGKVVKTLDYDVIVELQEEADGTHK